MPPVIPTFGYISLTESINQIKPVVTGIKTLLFKDEKTHAAKAIQTDIISGKSKLAPFVKRGHPAKIMSQNAMKTALVEPPTIRIKKPLTAEDLLMHRAPGSSIYVPGSSGGDQVAEARKLKIAMEQKEMRDTIERTIENMCCQVIVNGKISYSDDDLAFEVDYARPDANKPTLLSTRKWDAPTTALPLDDLDAWELVIRKATGKIATMAIMSTATFNKMIATTQVTKYLNLLKVDLGEVKTDPVLIAGGLKRVANLKNIDFFTYDNFYQDSAGDYQPYFADGKVVMLSPSENYKIHYGMIEDLKSGPVIGKVFSKDWVTEDPSEYNILAESHPLPVAHWIEEIVSATVY